MSDNDCPVTVLSRTSICNGGASDDIEVANHDDSRGAPNTISWRHAVCGVVLPRFYIKLTAISELVDLEKKSQ